MCCEELNCTDKHALYKFVRLKLYDNHKLKIRYSRITDGNCMRKVSERGLNTKNKTKSSAIKYGKSAYRHKKADIRLPKYENANQMDLSARN